MAHHHHLHRRSVSRQLWLWLYRGQEYYNLLLFRLLAWLRRPRVSSRSQLLPDGRVKKKIRFAVPRPSGSLIASPDTMRLSGYLIIVLLFLAVVISVFGEAFVNRHLDYRKVVHVDLNDLEQSHGQ
ncbi:MAG TPA: hypothetical protein PKM88_02675 [bacterium]|nr:hypothetical protein [bacterium]